jgi:hypothetical protein
MKFKAAILLIIVFGYLACNDGEDTDQETEINYTQAQLDSVNAVECEQLFDRILEQGLDTFNTSSYIPKNFDECIAQIDTLLNDSLKAWAKCLPDDEFGRQTYHSFGSFISDIWSLYEDSELTKHFFDMGLTRVDDIPLLLLNSYQRKLKGQDINLDGQIKYYQDFWKEADKTADSE